jgi:hypothetical protein
MFGQMSSETQIFKMSIIVARIAICAGQPAHLDLINPDVMQLYSPSLIWGWLTHFLLEHSEPYFISLEPLTRFCLVLSP